LPRLPPQSRAKHVRRIRPRQRRGLEDCALHGFVVGPHAARLAQLYVDDLARGQLHDVEYGLGIALQVGRDNDIAADLGLDAADVIGVRFGMRRVGRGFLLCLTLALGLRLQRFGFPCLALARIGEALLLLQFLVCVLLFLLLAVVLSLLFLESLLLFLERDVGLRLLDRRRWFWRFRLGWLGLGRLRFGCLGLGRFGRYCRLDSCHRGGRVELRGHRLGQPVLPIDTDDEEQQERDVN
jgi:hypothetical protein